MLNDKTLKSLDYYENIIRLSKQQINEAIMEATKIDQKDDEVITLIHDLLFYSD